MKYSSREWLILKVLGVIFMVGAAGLSLEMTQDLFISLMPLSLITAISLMLWMHSPWKVQHVPVFLGIALGGYLIEMAGVATGDIFGNYRYGSALGLQIWETPILIGVNWLMLIYSIYALLQGIKIHPVAAVLIGSALMVIFDFFMEPVAMKLDMWSWQGDVIPFQNYLAWFVISMIMLSALYLFRIRYLNRIAPFVFFIQMVFFLTLNIVL